jgi:hypothetical protein
VELEALAVTMPAVSGHPNRMGFQGVLTRVDEPSERAPAGARGHRVFLTREAAERALASLVGMALDHTPALDGHDARRKVGIITAAEIEGRDLRVEGYLFARDFPDVVREIRLGSGRLGMSYELADARVEDVRAEIWRLTEVTFTGAAILLKQKAAYGRTWIEMKGAGMKQEQMTELTQSAQKMAAAAEALTTTLTRLEAQHAELADRVERIVAAVDAGQELRERIAELEAQNAELKARRESRPASPGPRKTLPPMVTSLLAKSGVEPDKSVETAALDAAMSSLSVEQRIAVKSQLARAGLIE